jgi:hypothetical protein
MPVSVTLHHSNRTIAPIVTQMWVRTRPGGSGQVLVENEYENEGAVVERATGRIYCPARVAS